MIDDLVNDYFDVCEYLAAETDAEAFILDWSQGTSLNFAEVTSIIATITHIYATEMDSSAFDLMSERLSRVIAIGIDVGDTAQKSGDYVTAMNSYEGVGMLATSVQQKDLESMAQRKLAEISRLMREAGTYLDYRLHKLRRE